MVSRWEKTRSDYLWGRSRPHTSKRRRSELLARRARRASRTGMGTSAEAFSEDVTDPLWRRMLETDEGTGEKLARLAGVPLLYGAVALFVGPAIMIAAILYAVMWAFAPKIGRLWSWPWFLTAVASLGLGVFMIGQLGWSPGTLSDDLVLVIDWAGVGLMCLWVQLTIGLLFTGVQIQAAGWSAVPRNAVPKSITDKNGSFRKTADKDKVRLSAYVGHGEVVEQDRKEPTKKVSLRDALSTSTGSEEPAPPGEDDEWAREELQRLEAQENEGEQTND